MPCIQARRLGLGLGLGLLLASAASLAGMAPRQAGSPDAVDAPLPQLWLPSPVVPNAYSPRFFAPPEDSLDVPGDDGPPGASGRTNCYTPPFSADGDEGSFASSDAQESCSPTPSVPKQQPRPRSPMPVAERRSPQPAAGQVAPILQLFIYMERGRRLSEQDQFTIQIMQGRRVRASATTQGGGSAITGGFTPKLQVTSGIAYRFNVKMASGSTFDALDYATRLQCRNLYRGGTPVDQLQNITDQIRLQAYDRVECMVYQRPKAAEIKVQKRTRGGIARFDYRSLKNADRMNEEGGYFVQTEHAAVVAEGSTLEVTRSLVDTEIRELAPANWILEAASCIDGNATGGANVPEKFGVLVGDTLQIPAARVLPRAKLQCTFESRVDSAVVAGKVILDTESWHPHDGVQGGAEVGQSGVAMRLTDCAQQVHSTAVSAADGSFRLPVTQSVAGQRVCVHQMLPVGFENVSYHGGGTQGRLDDTGTRLEFTWQPDGAYLGLVFGNTPQSTLTSQRLQLVAPGQTVRHVVRYVAGSYGVVDFTSEVVNPDSATPWQHTWYMDPNCAPTSGRRLVRVPSLPLTVVAGQALCLVVDVQSPLASADAQAHRIRIRANQRWRVPTLAERVRNRRLEITLSTAIGAGGLGLLQEQRLLQTCPDDAAQSLANPAPFDGVPDLRPGDAVEYRFSYLNASDTALTQIELQDRIPMHMRHARAYCLDTPTQGLAGCSVVQEPVFGAQQGEVRWRLQDATGAVRGLQARASGAVSLCLYVVR